MKDLQVDVYDEQGNSTGETVSLQQAHDRELWHPVALVWVYNSQGEVLMQHRSEERDAFVNTWDVSASGHIRSGDSAIATATAELREAMGIQVGPSEIIELGNLSDQFPLINGKTHREHVTVFLVQRDINLERMEFQTAEVNGARWMSLRDLAVDMEDPSTRQQYAARNPEVYRLALEATWNLTAPD